jgi:CPA1 family monovalent cation:H+ antiporter
VIGVACYNGKMPEQVVLQLQRFWELVDELLNAILFVLIGFVMLFMYYDLHLMLTSLLLIPGILLIRFISVLIPFLTIQRFRGFQMSTILMMTWGGLRGGVSIALALSLPGVITHREVLITMTYVVVMFSILVQGLTIGPLIQKLSSKGAD